MTLAGSCRCGAVHFTVDSNTPYPYMRCYCSICRKIGGGGGYAINIMGIANTLDVKGDDNLKRYSVVLGNTPSTMYRSFCKNCGSALWGADPRWPDLVHPFASAIDTDLPKAPAWSHIMLDFKASWVEPDIRDDDATFARYPDQSIEDWHKSRNLWIG